MHRRTFVMTSAGFAAGIAAPGCWAFETRVSKKRAIDFGEYKSQDNAVPIQRVTPDDMTCIRNSPLPYMGQ